MIREAIDKLQIKIAEEIISKYSISSLNEASVAELRKNIIGFVKGVNDINVLSDIQTILAKEEFVEKITSILEQKGAPAIKDSFIKEFFSVSGGTLEEKREFLESIENGGIIDKNKFFRKTPSELSSMFLVQNSFIKRISNKLFSWIPKGLSKTGVGAGEALFMLYIDGAEKPLGTSEDAGDLVVDGVKYEVKSVSSKTGSGGARLSGASGYGSFSGYYKTFIKELDKKVGEANRRMVEANTGSKENTFNFNRNGLKNLSSLFTKETNKDLQELVLNAYMYVFPKYSKSNFKKLISTIKDGNIDFEEFKKENIRIQFDYYKKLDDWKGIVFLNESGKNIVYVENSDELVSLYENGNMNIGASLSWKEPRNFVYQYGLKG